ncbi:MAG: pyruvate kinase [Candidatus Omnitrophica bacterium]|nr:pyruvate kinase [Candidatus Omnitrophota bacterium]
MREYWNSTKVICTIGPACNSRKVIKELILAGMDIARFNFSHGKPADHVKYIKLVKAAAQELKSPVAILQDLPGPKIRLGELTEESIYLNQGQIFTLTSRKVIGTNSEVCVNHSAFIQELKKDNIVYLNDGLVKLQVISTNQEKAVCSVLLGGRIYPRKGVSCPNQFFKMSSVTAYDLKCLKYGIEAGVDFIAVSFVQQAKDIIKAKNYLNKRKKHISVVAKIERKVAFQDIDNIINVSDAIMVARGDLGIEADLEDVPFLQKEIIRKCNAVGKPVITATQMLESMVVSPQPTRAEVTDVANAILDGTDALMLSEETAVGKYPVQTLKMMLKIANRAEKKLCAKQKELSLAESGTENLVSAFSRAAVNISNKLNAQAIIAPTHSAKAISWLSRCRPQAMIVGVTTDQNVLKQMIMYWGVYPLLMPKFAKLGKTLDDCIKLTKKNGLVKPKDTVLVMLTEDNQLFLSNIMEVRRI